MTVPRIPDPRSRRACRALDVYLALSTRQHALIRASRGGLGARSPRTLLRPLEGHLRRVIDEYLVHYNQERDNQGIGNEVVGGRFTVGTGPVEYTERLGGLLKFYKRAA